MTSPSDPGSIVTVCSRERACLHEAGHAVGALLLEIPFTGVWVANVGDPLGGTEHPGGQTLVDPKKLRELVDGSDPAMRERRIRDIVQFYLFGCAAENGPPPAEHQPDAKNALMWAREFTPADPQSVVDSEFAGAVSLCSEHRDAINRVKARLEGPPKGITDYNTYLSSECVKKLVRGC